MDKSIIVGVDVSKGWLDLAAAGGGQVERLDNTSEAITPWLRRVRPALVAFEPTGGYERAPADLQSPFTDYCRFLRPDSRRR